jgi:protein-tyrosine phosphatase
MIDLHCHILPGLDDGAERLEESVEMARAAEEDGIEKIVATPHLFRDNLAYEDLSIIEEKKEELNQALKTNNINVEIFAGAEVNISHHLLEQIRENRSYLTLHQSSFMFVEFPPDHVFSGVKELFFELMSEGITPIIAHPERNSVFIHHPGPLYELLQMGALAQANSGSFLGMYGSTVESAVLRLLQLNLIQFIGSDGHNSRSKAPRLSEAVKIAASLIGEERAKALVKENPQAVLDDQQIPDFPEPINPEEKERKLRVKLPSFLGRDKK